MKTNLIAIMLCLFCVTIFSGCSKTVTYMPCQAKEPARLYSEIRCAGDDFEFAKCIIEKKEALLSDYNNLILTFEACK